MVGRPRVSGERIVAVPTGAVTLEGALVVPENALGVVLFAHGSGSSRHSPRNIYVAEELQRGALVTLLVDLLTPDEETVDVRTRELRFDIGMLADRLQSAIQWLASEETTQDLPVGLFGASTGGGAAPFEGSVLGIFEGSVLGIADAAASEAGDASGRVGASTGGDAMGSTGLRAGIGGETFCWTVRSSSSWPALVSASGGSSEASVVSPSGTGSGTSFPTCRTPGAPDMVGPSSSGKSATQPVYRPPKKKANPVRG